MDIRHDPIVRIERVLTEVAASTALAARPRFAAPRRGVRSFSPGNISRISSEKFVASRDAPSPEHLDWAIGSVIQARRSSVGQTSIRPSPETCEQIVRGILQLHQMTVKLSWLIRRMPCEGSPRLLINTLGIAKVRTLRRRKPHLWNQRAPIPPFFHQNYAG